MPRIQHIFLDMDGVLSDFTVAALRVHGANGLLADWPRGEQDFAKVLGISRGDFWRKIDAVGKDFWDGLEPYPWFEELIGLVRETGPFSILTAPSLSPGCMEGKAAWLRRHFPKVQGRSFRDFLMGPQKHLLAGPGRVLIDDTESQVEAFRAAGGSAILFPQCWNQNHALTDPIDYLRRQLAELAG